MKKIIISLLLIFALSISFVSCTVDDKDKKGNETADQISAECKAAIALIDEGKYEEAYELLKTLEGDKDAEKYLSKFRFMPIGVRCHEGEDLYHSTAILGENNLPSKVIWVDIKHGQESTQVYEYKFNSKGKISEIKNTYAENTHYDRFTYDAKGNLIKALEIYADGGESSFDYTYDASGNKITSVYTLKDGRQWTYNWTYDSKGNLIKEGYTQGGPHDSYEYTYDENGNKIKELHTDPYGIERLTTLEYTFDEKGNPKVVKVVSTDTRFFNYSYDANGNLLSESCQKNGEDVWRYTYSYDENGNCLKETFQAYGGEEHTYDYTYDENGNLIKEVRTENGESETYIYKYKLVYISLDIPDDDWEAIEGYVLDH